MIWPEFLFSGDLFHVWSLGQYLYSQLLAQHSICQVQLEEHLINRRVLVSFLQMKLNRVLKSSDCDAFTSINSSINIHKLTAILIMGCGNSVNNLFIWLIRLQVFQSFCFTKCMLWSSNHKCQRNTINNFNSFWYCLLKSQWKWKILADKGRSCAHHYEIATTVDGIPDRHPLSELILCY